MTAISNLPRVTSIGSNSLFLVVENGISKVVTWAFIESRIKGTPGVTGSSGFIGSRGPFGFTGSSSGFTGSQGPKGDIGSPGGFVGSQGPFGFVGSSGLIGFTGSTGMTGSQGVGLTGSTGFIGSFGYSGSIGFVGSQGAGFTGSQGVKGDPGNPGGYTGSSGAVAAQGFTGSSGLSFVGSRGIGFVGSSGTIGFTGSSSGGGGLGLGARITASSTTGSLSANQTGNLAITGYKSYALLKVQTSSAAWVRIYTSGAQRTADSARTQGNDPVPGSGVIAEVITTGATTQIITPGAIGWNDESPVNSTVYLAVTNLTSGNQTIVVTLTMLQLEV